MDQRRHKGGNNILAGRNTVFNPLRQNYGHIKALSNPIGILEKLFVSVLVFPNETKLMMETNEAAAIVISGTSHYK